MAAETVPKRFFCPNPLEASDLMGDPEYVETAWKRRPSHGFMQVFSIQVVKPNSGKENNYDGKEKDGNLDLEQIYGRINVSYLDDIFERQIGEGSRHDIDPNGFFRLSGPNSPFCVECSHIIMFPKVYRGNQPNDFFHPDSGRYKYNNGRLVVPIHKVPFLDEVGVGGSYLSSPYTPECLCNKVIITKMPTICGTLKLASAIYTEPLESYLIVKLLEWNGEGSYANFYGKIFAKNTRLESDGRAKSLVFDRKRDEEDLYVEPHKCLPLLRPSNVVSFGYALLVNVNIMHKSGVSLSKEHDLVIKERLRFQSKCPTGGSVENGIFESKVIRGEWGALEVKVYWSPIWTH